MRISLIFALVLLAGCKHIGLLFEPPGTLKAIIQGQIKGKDIHCEKTLSLGRGKWEIMCKVSDDIDIKYRTKTLENNQTKLELLIDRKKGNSRKIVAAPTMIVKRGKVVELKSIAHGSYFDIKAEKNP
jgi:hypothetical protein